MQNLTLQLNLALIRLPQELNSHLTLTITNIILKGCDTDWVHIIAMTPRKINNIELSDVGVSIGLGMPIRLPTASSICSLGLGSRAIWIHNQYF